MTQYKVGTRINLQKRKQERSQKIVNLVFTLTVGILAAYGLADLILRSHGI